MTDEEAQDIVDKWKGRDDMESVRQTLSDINDRKLSILHDAGLLTDEEYSNIRNTFQFYAPLYRVGKAERGSSSGRITGPLGRQIRARSGSLLGIESILAHTIENYQSAVSAAHKAEVGRALHDLVQENPDPDVWWIEDVLKSPSYDKDGNIQMYPSHEEPSDGVFVKIGGEKKLIRVNKDSARMMRLMKSIKDPVEMGRIVKRMGQVNRYLAMVNTSLSLPFMLTNFTRDIQTAGINLEDSALAGMQAKVMKDVFPAIRGIWNAERHDDTTSQWALEYRDFELAGGKIGWAQSYETTLELAKKMQSDLDMMDDGHVTKKSIRALGSFIETTNTAVENGVRLAVYKNLVPKVGRQQAAFAASNLTVDFTKKGALGPNINAFYLFFNANVQGSAKLISAAKRSPKIRKMLGGIVVAGFAGNLLGLLMGGEDDEDGVPYYEKSVPEYLKERNLIIMVPGSKGKYVQIPMPWGYNAFYALGHEMSRATVAALKGQEYSPIKGAAGVLSTFANAFNPLASSSIIQTLSPTAVDPLAMIAENRTWFGGPLMPAKDSFSKVERPDSQRFWRSVSSPSKFIAKELNRLTFGDTVKKGMIDISPESLDLWYDTLTGAAGRFVKQSLDLPYKAIKGEEIRVKSIPFVRSFFGQPSEYGDYQLYQKNVVKVLTLREQWKAAEGERKKGFSEDKYFTLIGKARATEKQLRYFRKRLNWLEANNGTDEQIETVKANALRVQKAFNKSYREVK